MRFRLDVDGETREIDVAWTDDSLVVRVDNAAYRTRPRPVRDSTEVRIGRGVYRVRLIGNEAVLDDGTHRLRIVEVSPEARVAEERPRKGFRAVIKVRPPMPGRVVRVAVSPGTHVRRGQTIIVLEAMKMPNEIPSPGEGVVLEVTVSEGETVTADRVVASVEVRGRSAS